ncbi:MAG: hypothetical protein HC933_12385 [Pleurocapsa sp. SU_196_0]|nr:hypothetical protein [Pleurocapsa sp. SU_196_0]
MQRTISNNPGIASASKSTPQGKVRSVVELYPLWDIVEGVALTEDGWCEVGVRLELPSRLFLAEDAVLAQHASVKTLLQQGVPVDARLRVYLSIEPEAEGALERGTARVPAHGLIDACTRRPSKCCARSRTTANSNAGTRMPRCAYARRRPFPRTRRQACSSCVESSNTRIRPAPHSSITSETRVCPRVRWGSRT